jgi:hypothetical protein
MNYFWIGHCKEGTSDKVWGMIQLPVSEQYGYPDYIAFWGRRGKKLQTKLHRSIPNWEVSKLCDKKEDRGYNTIDVNRLEEVYPEFESDLESTAIWAMLKV